MKALLTSSGITNPTLKNVLQQLAGKPLTELSAVFIPTAASAVNEEKTWLIENLVQTRDCGFKYLDIVDIAAVKPENWRPRLEKADIIFMGGGNTFHLMWHITQSGLAEILQRLLESKIYVGISAGSMVMGPRLDIPYNDFLYPGETNEMGVKDGLSIVDFCLLPHLNSEYFTNLRENKIAKCAEEIDIPTYAVDDNTAIKIEGDKLEVVGEGDHIVFNDKN